MPALPRYPFTRESWKYFSEEFDQPTLSFVLLSFWTIMLYENANNAQQNITRNLKPGLIHYRLDFEHRDVSHVG